MANMSYCRFENTYRALQDCLYALNNSGPEDLSDSELKFANMMMQTCNYMLSFQDEILDEVERREEVVE
jgi:hypothetical protein